MFLKLDSKPLHRISLMKYLLWLYILKIRIRWDFLINSISLPAGNKPGIRKEIYCISALSQCSPYWNDPSLILQTLECYTAERTFHLLLYLSGFKICFSLWRRCLELFSLVIEHFRSTQKVSQGPLMQQSRLTKNKYKELTWWSQIWLHANHIFNVQYCININNLKCGQMLI